MGELEIGELPGEAERHRLGYTDALDRGDLESAYRIALEELVPVLEKLAETDHRHHDALGVTLSNLSTVCHHLKRPISGFYFVQRALHAAILLDIRNLPINEGLVDIGFRTELYATVVVDRCLSAADLPEPEREMIVPAVALIPKSIDMLRRLDGYHAACQLRVAATRLRTLADGPRLDIVDHESKSMVRLARFAHGWDDRDFAIVEIGAALNLWLRQLDDGARFWSAGLLDTWTIAADILESLSLPDSAAALRGAIAQAGAGDSDALDLREHYRVALAGLRS
jgi:hypothetical protein